MANRNERMYEIYDADADFDATENSMIAEYSVIERQMDHTHGKESWNQPVLPSGQVIDSKNTLQSYDIPSSNTTTPTTSFVSNNNVMNSGGFIAASSWNQQKSNVAVSSTANSAQVTNTSYNSQNEEVQAIAIVEGKAFSESPPRSKAIWWVLGILAIVLAVAVVAGVCASGKCSAKSDPPPITGIPTSSPTFHPSMSPTFTSEEILIERVVTSFIRNITYSKEEIMVNGKNAESRALTWLINDDQLFNESALLTLDGGMETEISFRVFQRYVLAIFWFQQTDENGTFVSNWKQTTGWVEYKEECDWYGVECEEMDLGGNVGEQNVVRGISFYDYYADEGNNYVGTIPLDIGLLTSLLYLELSSNAVFGSLPESIVKCSLLRQILIAKASMTGSLLSAIGQLTDMTALDVSENGYYGQLPNSTEQWLNLTFFDVANNRFSGRIPDFIGDWTALTTLSLFSNSLSGTIPSSIGSLTNLTFLNVGGNDLTGTLPSSMGGLVNLVTSSFSFNKLKGTIPASIGNWSQIRQIWFYRNMFSGTVPVEICVPANKTNADISIDCSLSCPGNCCKFFEDCGDGFLG